MKCTAIDRTFSHTGYILFCILMNVIAKLLFNLLTIASKNIETDELFLSRTIYSDECVFDLDGKVNVHIVRNWETENPQERTEVTRYAEK